MLEIGFLIKTFISNWIYYNLWGSKRRKKVLRMVICISYITYYISKIKIFSFRRNVLGYIFPAINKLSIVGKFFVYTYLIFLRQD